jgi:hypothetical protein
MQSRFLKKAFGDGFCQDEQSDRDEQAQADG